MAKYTTEILTADVKTGEFYRECVDVQKFLKCCQSCPQYRANWSCPPFEFNVGAFWNSFDDLHLYAVVIYPDKDLTEQELMDAFWLEQQTHLELLLRQENPNKVVLSAGSCKWCKTCAKQGGEPCRYPEKMRYSIEALGGDVEKTASKYLNKELQWIQDGKMPSYVTLVFGILERKDIKQNYKYFCNTKCEYFPCHEKTFDGFNCLFCYCPLYKFDKCIGNPTIIEYGDIKIKDCSKCTVPHRPENYEKIIEFFNKHLYD